MPFVELTRGVTVALQTLDLSVQVRILAGQLFLNIVELTRGVTVALQILVLPVQVRILAGQPQGAGWHLFLCLPFYG